jgi:S1-C subfamily serine protease
VPTFGWRRAAHRARQATARWLGGALAAVCLPLVCGHAAAGDTGSVRSGTAFFITPTGFLLTSAHVVTGCTHIQLWPLEGQQREASVVARDPVRDVALLSTGQATPAFAPPALGISAQIGQELTTVGFGVLQHSPRLPVLSRGAMLGYTATEYANRTLVIGADLPEGNSGGPVVDGSGLLVGMVIGRFREPPARGVALPVEELAKFAAKLGAVETWKASAGGHVEAVTSVLYGVSGLIQCGGE